ncbi:MAG: hypothetical protein GY946_31105 [bacterium]|nr:hypothetical protein [bacterium]
MRHLSTSLLCLIPLAATLLLASCGGGLVPNPLGVFEEFFDALPRAVRALEGSMAQDGTSDPRDVLRVGDDDTDRSWRAFTSFETPTLEAGETLTSAILELYQGDQVGNPYDTMGLLFVERVDMGASLDVTDLTAPAGARSLGFSDPAVGQVLIDVTAHVQEAMDLGLPRVDFRLRFGVSVRQDDTAQQTTFTSFDQSAVQQPTLPPTLRIQWSQPAP